MKKFYAYSFGELSGIVSSWEECKEKIRGKRARYRKFDSKELAESWLSNGFKLSLPEGIYFDAGTGAGEGTEVRVTDAEGKVLIENTNKRGNVSLPDKTNNFGELYGIYLALKLAAERGVKKIFGDSKLVIDYWSKGFIKKTLPTETVALAEEVKRLRHLFELDGGKIEYVPGDINPADLGFHR